MAIIVRPNEQINNAQYQKCETIFLAGPCHREPLPEGQPSWREEVFEFAKNWNNLILVTPEPKRDEAIREDLYYVDQMDWELKRMGQADVILFWVPRDLVLLPGFTTNVEFGFWVAKNPKKIIFGCPEGAPKTDYLRALAERRGVFTTNNLAEAFEQAFRIAVLRKQKRHPHPSDEAFRD